MHAAQGRPGLDRDEVPGEGPHAALRDGQRSGGGHQAASEQRAGGRPSAEHSLSVSENRFAGTKLGFAARRPSLSSPCCSASLSAPGRRCAPRIAKREAVAAQARRSSATTNRLTPMQKEADAGQTRPKASAGTRRPPARLRLGHERRHAGAGRKQSRPRAGFAEPPAAPAGPERFARLGMALSLAANPQRRLVHPLPGIQRNRIAGGFSRWPLAGDRRGPQWRVFVWDLRTRQEVGPPRTGRR